MGRPPRAAVRAAVRAHLGDLMPGDRVFVALSGGPDSLALTGAAATVSARAGLLCEAIVIDHRLQPGSDEVAARAAEQAQLLGCHRARVVVVDVATGSGAGGPEAAARTARYRALDAAVAGGTGPQAAVVLLGHTRDDQAETVLLGMARGSGTRSLAGMAAIVGPYRRPLLDLPRAVVHAAAAEQASADPRLLPWTDPQNAEPAFTRARVRREVLPHLEATLGPGVSAGLARTARLARADADALDSWAERVWHEAPRQLPGERGEVARLGPVTVDDGLPAAILSRVVRRFLVEAGSPVGQVRAEHVAGAAALLTGTAPDGAEVALPGGLRAHREGGVLVVRA